MTRAPLAIMLKDDTKQLIEAMTTDEMAYEINRGHRSRFQRDNFAYLKTCYELRSKNNQQIGQKTSEGTITSYKTDNWYNRPIGIIGITVISAVLAAFVINLIWHYFGIQLYG